MPSITPPTHNTTDVSKPFEISPIFFLFLIIGIICFFIIILAFRNTKKMMNEEKTSNPKLETNQKNEYEIAQKVMSITENEIVSLNELETHLLDHFRACDLDGKAEILTFAAQVHDKKK